MASLHTCPLASLSIRLLRRPSAGFRHSHSLNLISPDRHTSKPLLNLRSRKEVKVQAKKRGFPVFASNSNPPDGSDITKTSDAAGGPPFLTILAGVVVFLFICWIIGSTVTWFIGLILHPPPLK